MGILDKLSSGASAASGIVGAAGGLASLIFGNSRQKSMSRYQQKLQMQLNEQQQQFARENAQTDYDRQRALVRDNASLEKAGRQAAGLSTAGDFGSGSASVSPISAPSAGSAPSMPDPNASMLAGIQTIQASANSLVQNRALELSNEHQELENAALREALPDYTKGIIGEGKSAAAKGEVDTASVDADKSKRHDESVITNNDLWESENKAAYASANAFANAMQLNQNVLLSKEALDKAKADKTLSQENLRLFQDTYDYAVEAAKQNVVNLKKQGKAIDASANASNAAAEDSREHAKVNSAQRDYILTQKDAQSLQNEIARATKDDVIAAARVTLKEHGPKSINEYSWSVFNNWDRATLAQKIKACFGLPFGFIERALGGASDEAGKAIANKIFKVK